MKCQQCERPATFHITELTGGKPQELHLCEEHARSYLTSAQRRATRPAAGAWRPRWPSTSSKWPSGRQPRNWPISISRPARSAASRSTSSAARAAWAVPHDYVAFQTQLEPLIVNVHGESEHVGKRPRRAAGSSETRTQLIRLRREMKEAVEGENYERASQLRDEIRRVETEQAS